MPRPPRPATEEKPEFSDDLAELGQLARELSMAPPEDEEAKANLRYLLGKVRRFSHEQRHGCACPMVTFDAPLHPLGEPYKINRKPIGPGVVTVRRCEAAQVMWQAHMAQEVDRQRMREGGRRAPVDLGSINARAVPQG